MLVAMSRVAIYDNRVFVKVLHRRTMVGNVRGCRTIILGGVTYKGGDDFDDFVPLMAGGKINASNNVLFVGNDGNNGDTVLRATDVNNDVILWAVEDSNDHDVVWGAADNNNSAGLWAAENGGCGNTILRSADFSCDIDIRVMNFGIIFDLFTFFTKIILKVVITFRGVKKSRLIEFDGSTIKGVLGGVE